MVKTWATSSLDEIQMTIPSGTDTTIVLGPPKRRLEIKSQGLLRINRMGRFGFLEYFPNAHSSRFRIFLDGEDTGVDRRNLPAAMIYAVTLAAMGSSDTVPYMFEVVCRLIGVANY